jgi:hypothetical protein
VHNGVISYRKITMEKEYARIGEDGVQFNGPATESLSDLKIAVFGPKADQVVQSPEMSDLESTLKASGRTFKFVAISSDTSWGKASTGLVNAVYQDQVLGIIALDRNSSHLAEQIGTKAFVPVIAISSDKALTSTNVPWIFRLPEDTAIRDAVQLLANAVELSGVSRAKVREVLASGVPLGGRRFDSAGEAH